MGREKLHRLIARQPRHILPQGYALPGREASGGHKRQAHQVGLPLVRPAEGQDDTQLCAQTQCLQQLLIFYVAEHAHQHQPEAGRKRVWS